MTNHDLIEHFFPTRGFSRRTPWVLPEHRMKVDITEDEKGYVVTADLPGFGKDSVDVQFADNVLSISASSKEEKASSGEEGESDAGEEGAKPRTVLRERYVSKCKRSFRFSQKIDKDSIDAKLADGVLTVKLSKRDLEEARRENRIEVN